MRTSTLLGTKNFELLESYDVPAWTKREGKLSQCGHFADKGDGSVFRVFVHTSFTDGPLSCLL